MTTFQGMLSGMHNVKLLHLTFQYSKQSFELSATERNINMT